LRSLSQQSDADFGRCATTLRVYGQINRCLVKIGHRLTHVWHEDRGFRAAEICNRAIPSRSRRLLYLLDGDRIVRRFCRHSSAAAEPGWFVTGNRTAIVRPHRKSAAGSAYARDLARRALARRTFARGRIVCRRCFTCRSGPARIRQRAWKARARAILPFGAPISIA
jgi:hypothetical protein